MAAPVRFATALFAATLSVAGAADAQATPATPARDRFGSTLTLGISNGVGSPRGILGAFVEYRPWPAVGVAIGTGLGGSFGAAVDGTVLLSPFGGRSWRFDVTGSFSRQFSYLRLGVPDGRSLPMQSNWISVGGAMEFRTEGGTMFRIGAGRAFLLDTSSYGVFSANEVSFVQSRAPAIPGATPLDAAQAALRGDAFGVWFASVEIGFSIGL